MNKPSRNKLVSTLALAAALVIPNLFPQTAQGMYDPKHGRWLQRDPMGVRPEPPKASVVVRDQYHDGMNLHQYVKSRPTDGLDPAGLVTRVQCGEKGKRPPLGGWVPGYSGTQVISKHYTGDWGAPLVLWDHYLSGKGESLWFPYDSPFTKFLRDTDAIKSAEEDIDAESRRESRGKLTYLKCDPPPPAKDGIGEERFCYTGTVHVGTFREGPWDYLGMGGIQVVYYADCEIKKRCCMGGRDCNYASYLCTVHMIIFDYYAFPGQWVLQRMGTPFHWYADYGSPSYHDWCTEGSGCRKDELHPWQRR